MTDPIIFLLISVIIIVLIFNLLRKSSWKKPTADFPLKWRQILEEKVSYYNSLSAAEKDLFEYKVAEFLLNIRITGIKTEVTDKDRVLIAASGIIPIFSFPEWQYHNLSEVLLYPKSFDLNFKTESKNALVLGAVGTGFLEGKMALSKQALHLGFKNESDKKNTAIHEFVHLIDKMDGNVDGVPELLLERQYTLPWLKLINEKITDINTNTSDIREYGATNRQEFFAVASEYFFERPKLFSKKHPVLYSQLEQIFKQDNRNKLFRRQNNSQIGRNDKCPCGSGHKFKHCCGKVHY